MSAWKNRVTAPLQYRAGVQLHYTGVFPMIFGSANNAEYRIKPGLGSWAHCYQRPDSRARTDSGWWRVTSKLSYCLGSPKTQTTKQAKSLCCITEQRELLPPPAKIGWLVNWLCQRYRGLGPAYLLLSDYDHEVTVLTD